MGGVGDNWSYDVQSSSQTVTTNIPTPNFLQAGCPSCRPTNSVKALKGKISHSMNLLTPSSPGGLPTLSLTTNSSWLPWRGLPYLSPAFWSQPVPRNSTLQLLIRYTEPPTLNRKLNPYIRCDGDRKFFLPEIDKKHHQLPFLLLCVICLTGSFFPQNTPGWTGFSIGLPKEIPQRIAGAGFFTIQMPFLSPNEQCLSTEGLETLNISLSFNGHFPGEPGLAGVYWSKGWWRWWWQPEL